MTARSTHAAQAGGHVGDFAAFAETIRQSQMSGARRRAAVLFTEHLPASANKPHHRRLFMQALQRLAAADRGQMFLLPHGRAAVIWRDRTGNELEAARDELTHLLQGHDGEPSAQALRDYQLPSQALNLLDDLAAPSSVDPPQARLALSLPTLSRLESALSQADLSRFVRVRAIKTMRKLSALESACAVTVWEERYFSLAELASAVCPDVDLRADTWLFARLTRTLDARMLAALMISGELAASGPLAISMNVASVLSPAFLRFDAALPVHLRGEVTLVLRLQDILSSAGDYAFMRRFAAARGYRLALAGSAPEIVEMLDLEVLGVDLFVFDFHELGGGDTQDWRMRQPVGSSVVLTGLQRPSEVRWALERDYHLLEGPVFSPA